ncbi:hypothetical protein AB0M36_34720 [Actinoplanes sp. NPDC051346]|uniref:DUF6197 family protein n=1 Tax=Actinoplanes sp. NPDC051346 TaxID=3155048 RepID=UPI00344410C1
MNRTQNPTGTAADTDSPAAVTPADILRGAADYLETHGWIQKAYYGPDLANPFPSACADGALGMAAYGECALIPSENIRHPQFRDYQLAADYLIGYLNQTTEPLNDDWTDEFTSDRPDPFGWNDAEGQTAEHVIATLRAAADEYAWQHASEDDIETYDDICAWREEHPTREGFLAWLCAR